MQITKINNNFLEEQLVILKDEKWLERQKYAGKCVAKVLNHFKYLVENKTPNLSLLDIDQQALEIINNYKCLPTFKDYKGFPGNVCLSVNEHLVHGIPSDYVLQEGDIVTLDLGATFEGAIADAAYSVIYGEPKSKEHVRMLKKCEEALYAGINAIKVGKRLGVIGNAIYKSVKDSGFGVVVNYGGHGINYDTPHAEPFVANKAKVDEGIRIYPGLSIAIEPMLTFGSPQSRVGSDGWTVITNNVGCHFEHSVTVMDDVHIITNMEQV